MPLLSVILPAHNEEDNIEYCIEKLIPVLTQANSAYEIIFVDDGSTDATFYKINAVTKKHENIHGISFSRNFGKDAAIFAGLSEVRGDCCVVMDCDMQHPLESVQEMYRLWEQGYQIVEGIKEDRGEESFFHRLFSKYFYSLISRFSGFDMSNSSDFKLLDREVVNTMLGFKEKKIFFRGLSFWVGYRSTRVRYSVAPRVHGSGKWSIFKLFKYAVDNIAGFSSFPMYFLAVIGILFLCAAFVLGVIGGVSYIVNGIWGGEGLVSLILAMGGGNLLGLGIVGYYIGRVYNDVKSRPTYVIAKRTDDATRNRIPLEQ